MPHIPVILGLPGPAECRLGKRSSPRQGSSTIPTLQEAGLETEVEHISEMTGLTWGRCCRGNGGQSRGGRLQLNHYGASLQGARAQSQASAMVAFSVASMPGDPPELDENWKPTNNGNVIKFLHRHIWKFSPDTPAAPRQGRQAHSTGDSSALLNTEVCKSNTGLPLRKKEVEQTLASP